MTPTPVVPPAPANFPAFPRLPADIRQEIWRSASTAPSTTTVPGVCILTLAIPIGSPLGRAQHAPLVVHTRRNPSLLGTSTEAYDITASSAPPPPRPFNPEIDTLFLGPSEFIYFTDHLTRRDEAEIPWFPEIRHLALTLTVVERGMALPMAMMDLHRLETVGVVYPGGEGGWDFEMDTSPPVSAEGEEGEGEGEEAKVLRELTEDEAKGCVIEADYVFEMHGGDQRIVWRRNVREHIGYVAATLGDFMRRVVAMENDEKRIPPTWDKRNGMLKLKYRALVWDEGTERLEFGSKEGGGGDEEDWVDED